MTWNLCPSIDPFSVLGWLVGLPSTTYARDFLVLFSQLVQIITWFRFALMISANVRTSASCLQEHLECKISGDGTHISECSPAPTHVPHLIQALWRSTPHIFLTP